MRSNEEYGLVGERLGHSFSPLLHEKFGDYGYKLFEVAKNDIDEYFRKADFRGVNVTIPYKETAMGYCTADGTAASIGCVNTLVKMPDGSLCGYNTDTYGFEYMAARALIDFSQKKVTILGSGGTCRTAAVTAARLGASMITIVSRHPKDLDIDIPCPIRYVSYDDVFDDCNVLVNTTPVGMYPDIDKRPVDINLGYVNLEAVIDVIYNPLNTRLIYSAKKRGIKSTGGLPMLIAQGYFASRLFAGAVLSKDPVGDLAGDEKEMIEEAIESIRQQCANVVLTGMPGSGKSTVGKLVAQKLGLEFIDTDEVFSKQNGISAETCIKESGEKAFRELEKKAVYNAAQKGGRVIATGGGVVLDPENIELLCLNGTVIYLHRKLKDLATKGRPLSKGAENLKALYYKRLPIYLSCCDMAVNVAGNGASVAEDIVTGLIKGRNKKMNLLVINGPNLNMLGIREPDIYGHETYEDLMRMCSEKGKELDADVRFFQSNHEGDLIDIIQQAYGVTDGIVINPGAYTHTSVALLDALKTVGIPAVEVHISDVDSREDFRKTSYIRQAVIDTVSGHGLEGYLIAMDKLNEHIRGH
ncbi:MAG: type II 3-dehydroquinate dehydratase [Lachnospiraceae bacterium]|nr:type II 3-dehydroquinate dehydratase [Lachnospiraceae bacterium]